MKFLWRVSIRRVGERLYLLAQNVQSAHAQATNHPEVAPEDLRQIQRIAQWDETHNMSVVIWPEPPPQPEPQPEPPP